MNYPEHANIAPLRRRNRKRHFFLALFLGMLLAGTVIVVSALRLSSHTQRLCDAVVKSIDAPCDKKFAVRIGGFMTFAARAISRPFELQPELRATTQALREAEVAVYRITREVPGPNRLQALDAVDGEMQRCGWRRMVVAVETHQWVAVYVPEPLPSPEQMKSSIVVLDGEALVIATVRADLEPLLNFARDRIDVAKLPKVRQGKPVGLRRRGRASPTF